MSIPKNKLHELVDSLPEGAMEEAVKYLESLVKREELKRALDAAPYDDEPVTEEDRRDIEEAHKEIEAGETVPLDEVKRMLGL